MDLDAVERRITPRTRAILAVHLYGLPVDMPRLLELARPRGIRVIEDAAQMHGQRCRGRPCGSFGDLSVFSFYPNKHLTTGEGGMVLTDDEGLAERCRSLRNLCFGPPQRFRHQELGWNYRMTNLQAAVGVAQLEQLDEAVARKRALGRAYRELLQDVPALQLQPERTGWAEHLCWAFGVVLGEQVPGDAAEVARRLAAEGIETRPFFWPMHEQPALWKRGLFAGEAYPVAERLARRGLYLPSGVGLTDAEQAEAAYALRRTLSEVMVP
jgi:perosamine synthetase